MIKMPKMSAEIKKKIFAKFQASATLENQLIKIKEQQILVVKRLLKNG